MKTTLSKVYIALVLAVCLSLRKANQITPAAPAPESTAARRPCAEPTAG